MYHGHFSQSSKHIVHSILYFKCYQCFASSLICGVLVCLERHAYVVHPGRKSELSVLHPWRSVPPLLPLLLFGTLELFSTLPLIFSLYPNYFPHLSSNSSASVSIPYISWQSSCYSTLPINYFLQNRLLLLPVSSFSSLFSKTTQSVTNKPYRLVLSLVSCSKTSSNSKHTLRALEEGA